MSLGATGLPSTESFSVSILCMVWAFSPSNILTYMPLNLTATMAATSVVRTTEKMVLDKESLLDNTKMTIMLIIVLFWWRY